MYRRVTTGIAHPRRSPIERVAGLIGILLFVAACAALPGREARVDKSAPPSHARSEPTPPVYPAATGPFQGGVSSPDNHPPNRIGIPFQYCLRDGKCVPFLARLTEHGKFFRTHRRHGRLGQGHGHVSEVGPGRDDVSPPNIQVTCYGLHDSKETHGVHTVSMVLKAIAHMNTGWFGHGIGAS